MPKSEFKTHAVNLAGSLFKAGVKRYMRSGGRRSFKRRRARVGRYAPSNRRIRMQNRRRTGRPLTEKYVKKKIKKMCRFMKQNTAVHVHRTRDTGRGICNVNVTGTASIDQGGKLSDIETAMSNLRFFDAATNSLVTANIAAGTYARDVMIAIGRKFTMVNNYQIPVQIQLFSCVPKDATGVDAYTAYKNGLIDQANPSDTSNLVKFRDSLDLKNIWTVKKVCDMKLQPGRNCVAYANTKQFAYNISTADSHTLVYQKNQGGHNWVLRVTGILAHDSVDVTEQGFTNGGIDYCVDTTYTITYDAGKDLHDVSVSDRSSGFTTGPNVSNKPMTAQQGFSL